MRVWRSWVKTALPRVDAPPTPAAGDGTAEDKLRPTTAVVGINTASSVVGGSDFFVALLANGTVWAWGTNQYGELGQDPAATSLSSAAPVQVPGITDAVQVTAGNSFACALRR